MKTFSEWRGLIEEELDRFGSHDSEHRFPADSRKTADWLIGEAALASVSLDRAVRQFSGTGQWPPLTQGEEFYLMQRLHLANQTLAEWQRPGESPAKVMLPVPPDPTEPGVFLPWLLVDLWAALGERFLLFWADSLMRQHPPPR